MNYILLPHAQEQMADRGITASELDGVLQSPQQVVPGGKGRNVYQSVIVRGNRFLMLRAIVDDRVDPALVVSVYLTSKSKYWSL